MKNRLNKRLPLPKKSSPVRTCSASNYSAASVISTTHQPTTAYGGGSSVFFNGGTAIHGTEAIYQLGRPASHGCVRTHPVSARRIYRLIRRYGKSNTTVIVRN